MPESDSSVVPHALEGLNDAGIDYILEHHEAFMEEYMAFRMRMILLTEKTMNHGRENNEERI